MSGGWAERFAGLSAKQADRSGGFVRHLGLGAAVLCLAWVSCSSPWLRRSVTLPGVPPSPEMDFYSGYLEARRAWHAGQSAEATEVYARLVLLRPESAELWTEYGQTASRAGQVQVAENAYREASRLDGSLIEPHLMLAQIFALTGRWAPALDEYEEVRRRQPDYPGLGVSMAAVALEAGELDRAKELLQELLEVEPEDPTLLYYWARLLSRQGQPEAAEDAVTRALRWAPHSSELLWERARLYKDSGRPEAALSEVHRLLSVNPAHAEGRTMLWQAVWDPQLNSEAAEILAGLTEQYPVDPFFPLALGWAHLEREAFPEALKAFRESLRRYPEFDEAAYGEGLTLESLENEAEAYAAFGRVRAGSSRYADATIRLALIEARGKKWDHAAERMSALLKTAPNEARYHEILGLIRQEQGDSDRALASLRRAAELEPENERILFRLGILLEEKSDREGSLDVMRRILRVNPTHANALNWVGYTYAESGQNLEEAEGLVRRALEVRPEDGYFVDSLGWVLFQRGDFEGALGELLRAVELTKDDPVIHEHLGDALLNLGRGEAARQAYERALKLSPKKDQLERLRRKVHLVPPPLE